jgi:thiazole synthase
MEWGFDGVLLNTAVSRADDPVRMAGAFSSAIKAGHSAFVAGPMIVQTTAVPSTPEIGRPFATDYSTGGYSQLKKAMFCSTGDGATTVP